MVHINVQEIKVSKDTLLEQIKLFGNFAQRYGKVLLILNNLKMSFLNNAEYIRAQKYTRYQRITLNKGYAHVLWKKLVYL